MNLACMAAPRSQASAAQVADEGRFSARCLTAVGEGGRDFGEEVPEIFQNYPEIRGTRKHLRPRTEILQ